MTRLGLLFICSHTLCRSTFFKFNIHKHNIFIAIHVRPNAFIIFLFHLSISGRYKLFSSLKNVLPHVIASTLPVNIIRPYFVIKIYSVLTTACFFTVLDESETNCGGTNTYESITYILIFLNDFAAVFEYFRG